MKTIYRVILAAAFAMFASAGAFAQPIDERERPRFHQGELDRILAPIALYPDALLSQLLMAATYPREVAEAAAWSRANRGLSGDDAVRAVDGEPWDPSVKSMVAFPQILEMMDERMDWTERLGDAFAASPAEVSDTIQELRRRADEAGNLRSGEEIVVRRDAEDYVIEPAQPEVVYVPYYDPRVVYGRWWWPEYEPIWWRPWVGYSWGPGYPFGWGYGISLGSGFFYSSFDWPRRYIRFNSHRPHYYRDWDRRHGYRWWHDSRGDGRRWNRDSRRDSRRWDGDRRGDARRRDGAPRGEGDRRREGRGDRDNRREGRRSERTPPPATAGSVDRRPATAPSAIQAPAYRAPGYRDGGVARDRGGTPRYSRPAPTAAPDAPVRAAPARAAPAPAAISRPAVREAPAPRESRPEPRESRSERRESRSDSSESRSGGGRGGGRSQQH